MKREPNTESPGFEFIERKKKKKNKNVHANKCMRCEGAEWIEQQKKATANKNTHTQIQSRTIWFILTYASEQCVVLFYAPNYCACCFRTHHVSYSFQFIWSRKLSISLFLLSRHMIVHQHLVYREKVNCNQSINGKVS